MVNPILSGKPLFHMCCLHFSQRLQLYHSSSDYQFLRMEGSEEQDLACSSSVDSCSHKKNDDFGEEEEEEEEEEEDFGSRNSNSSIDLKLRLKFPSSPETCVSKQREKRQDWPPINPILRNTLVGKSSSDKEKSSLFVKVYMEGIPIGRKLDLYAFDGYDALLTALSYMFETFVFCGEDADGVRSGKRHYVLTYEDKEGDWMMVGDIPWEMFVSNVKRMKIARPERC